MFSLFGTRSVCEKENDYIATTVQYMNNRMQRPVTPRFRHPAKMDKQTKSTDVTHLFTTQNWKTIAKILPPKDLLNFRLVCTKLNSCSIERVYQLFHLKIVRKAVKANKPKVLANMCKSLQGKQELQCIMTMKFAPLKTVWRFYNYSKFGFSEVINNGFNAFLYAATKGYIGVLKEIAFWVDDKDRKALMHCYNYAAFIIACSNGHYEVMQFIYELSTEEDRNAMIRMDRYAAFSFGCDFGYLNIIRKIYEWANERDRRIMLSRELSKFSIQHCSSD